MNSAEKQLACSQTSAVAKEGSRVKAPISLSVLTSSSFFFYWRCQLASYRGNKSHNPALMASSSWTQDKLAFTLQKKALDHMCPRHKCTEWSGSQCLFVVIHTSELLTCVKITHDARRCQRQQPLSVTSRYQCVTEKGWKWVWSLMYPLLLWWLY